MRQRAFPDLMLAMETECPERDDEIDAD